MDPLGVVLKAEPARLISDEQTTCFPASSPAVATKKATVTLSASSPPVARLVTTLSFLAMACSPQRRIVATIPALYPDGLRARLLPPPSDRTTQVTLT